MRQRCLGDIKRDFGVNAAMVLDDWLLAKNQGPKYNVIKRYLGLQLEDLRRRLAQEMAKIAVEAHTPCPPCPPCPEKKRRR